MKAEHRGSFIADAEEGSRAGEAQLDGLLAKIDETKPVVVRMWDGWSSAGIPIRTDDLDNVRRLVAKIRREFCWPDRSEEKWQARKAAEQAQPAARLSNREALARSGGETA
jgi:hypothetical protein